MAEDKKKKEPIKMFTGTGKTRKVCILTPDELDEVWPTLTPAEKKEACLYQKFPIKFIKEHHDEIDFVNLSTNPSLTFDIMDTFANDLSWKTICLGEKKLSDTFLYNFRLRVDWDLVLRKQQLEAEILVHLAEAFRKSTAKEAKKNFWKALSRHQEMDVPFIEAYKRYLDFDEISRNPAIPEDVLQHVLPMLNLIVLLNRTDLSKDFIVRNLDFFAKDPKVMEEVRRRHNK